MNSEETLNKRILAIDILRGMVMVIMALDHVRDFFHDDAMLHDPMNPETTTLPLYFTRWITHYCAPVFVFLSGISAWLSGLKKTGSEQALHLIKRGLFLIVIEFTVVNFGWTFNPYFNTMVMQVIWAIGFSMLILGLVSFLPRMGIGVLALGIVLGHNLIDVYETEGRDYGFVLNVLHYSHFNYFPFSETRGALIVYPVLPWIGIMLLGYFLGKWFESSYDSNKRKRNLLLTGATMIIGFILLRIIGVYGDPGVLNTKAEGVKLLMSFLDVSKYPPSLMFTGMTLGPACLFLALTVKGKSRIASWLMVYGRVPFFYYILHIYVIHLLAVLLFFASGYTVGDISGPNSMFNFRPADMGFHLSGVYLIWLAIVAGLYFPCRWYYKYKSGKKHWIFTFI